VTLVRAVRAFRPDLVYFTCAPSIGLTVRDAPYMLLLRMLGIPAVAHLHGGNVPGFFGGGWVRRTLNRWGLATCRAILVITRECEAAGREIFADDQVIYVPNMLDDDLLARQQPRAIRPADALGPWRLLHVAWQSVEKGSYDLVRAMPHVRHAVDCRLVGTAAPEHRDALERLMADLGVADRIRLMGQKRGDDLDAEFRDADVFVLPTHRGGPEGFPMVVLEAMTYGLPIVANEVGNIAEMIAARTGRPAGVLLEHVDPVDPAELAAKIDALLDDAPRRAAYSEDGRARIRAEYLASKVVPQLEDLLAALVRGNPKGPERHRWGRVDGGES
jgi:glycosyltransferase involved in cell wall biosynthesis